MMTSKRSYETGQVVDRATIRQIYSTRVSLSLPEAQAILDVHQSGVVRKLTEIAGTWMNTTDALQRLDLNEWQGIIEEALTSDEALQQAITGISASFFEQLAAAMAHVSMPPVEDPPVLLWCDPVFHNMLVSSCSSGYRLSGIFDFQQAGYGHPITDLMYVEGDFGRRRPPGVYEHPDYVRRFYDGYRAITGHGAQVPDELRQMNVMIRFALGVRFDWNCMRCFTPAVPAMLQEMLSGLNQLSEE